jgi:hypothetical protein
LGYILGYMRYPNRNVPQLGTWGTLNGLDRYQSKKRETSREGLQALR